MKFHAYNLPSLNIACLIVLTFLALITTDNTNIALMVHGQNLLSLPLARVQAPD